MLRVLFLNGFLLFALLAFRRQRRIRAILWAVLGIWLVRYFQPVSDWLQTLGQDSLAEAQKFAISEAWFFLETLGATLVPMHWDRVLVLVVATAALTLALGLGWRWLATRFGWPALLRWERSGLFLAAVASIAVPLVWQLSEIAPQFRSNSDIYASASKHFANQAERLTFVPQGNSEMRVIVYIGESTTSMHWSLYGYPLSTTPQLAAFAREHAGLLKFENVVSTQTLTSQSLLEALSIGIPGGSDYLPITDRPRASLVDVLKHLNIPTFLMSTQGNTGVWNLASSIIFSGVDSRNYASATSVLGQSAAQGEASRVWDDIFFSDAVQKFKTFRPAGTAVAFLHSYAGHGVYADHIPPRARRTGDAFLNDASPSLIYGEGVVQGADKPGLLDSVQNRIESLLDGVKGGGAAARPVIADYDDAMRYIDGNLAHLFRQVANEEAPTVVLYFSDHGESPGTGVGHDSSRFQHEMTRVPFLMYFNRAAQQVNPKLFAEFREAAEARRAATLAQVPATILSLLGYRVQGSQHDYRGVGLDAEEALVPVVVRKLVDGMVYVRTHGVEREHRSDARDLTDPAATIWLNSKARSAGKSRPALCYGGVNTWAKANRGAIVADCLATRLEMDEEQIDAAPLDKKAPGWALDALARVASARHLPLWLDGASLPLQGLCVRLDAWLGKQGGAVEAEHSTSPRPSVMLALAPEQGVGFPPACADLNRHGVEIFMRVPSPLMGDAEKAGTWARGLVAAGWPARYALSGRPGGALREALRLGPESQWVLLDIPVDELPWSEAAAVPLPAFMVVDTAWDPNIRK